MSLGGDNDETRDPQKRGTRKLQILDHLVTRVWLERNLRHPEQLLGISTNLQPGNVAQVETRPLAWLLTSVIPLHYPYISSIQLCFVSALFHDSSRKRGRPFPSSSQTTFFEVEEQRIVPFLISLRVVSVCLQSLPVPGTCIIALANSSVFWSRIAPYTVSISL